MVSQKVTVKNATGLHLRPAGVLCKEAMQFKSLITFTKDSSTANAKSVLSVLGACVKCGDEIELVCEAAAKGICGSGAGRAGRTQEPRAPNPKVRGAAGKIRRTPAGIHAGAVYRHPCRRG